MALNFKLPFQRRDPLKLNSVLASNASADETDVETVKQHLNTLGHYEIPSYGITKWPDNQLFEGIKSFQREKKLTVDGYMKPEGETEAALNDAINQRPKHDPATERQEAVIAFAGKYGISDDKARDYMTKPSIFKLSAVRKNTAANSVLPSEGKGQVAQNTPQQQILPRQPAAPSSVPQPKTAVAPNSETKTLSQRVRERADSRRPTMPDAFINSLVDDDFMEGLPADKRDIVKANIHDWRKAQIDRWKTGTPLSTDYALRTILAYEGVMKPTNPDPEKKEATAAGGITNDTLKTFKNYMQKSDDQLENNPIKIAARNRLRDANIERAEFPRYLSAAQATALAKSYHDENMYRIGGHEAVELINNRQAGAAFLDTLYRHGGPNGTRAIQRAVNRLRPNTLKEDGILGETTFEAYQQLADKPEDWEKLSAHLYEERIADRQRANPKIDAGDMTRFRFFVAPSQQTKP